MGVATYFLTTSLKSVSSMKLHRDLGVTKTTAWYLANRIREVFEKGDENFSGTVGTDESYFGGLEKNKHRDKKLNEGRRTVGKTAVAGLIDVDINQVTAKVIQNNKRITLHGFINANVEQGSTVCTDDFKIYRNKQDYDHRFVKHSVDEYVDENFHINGMESFLRVLKRAHKGKLHKISHKHLTQYVTEFAGRHNHRSLDTINRMECIALGMVGKRMKYKEPVA